MLFFYLIFHFFLFWNKKILNWIIIWGTLSWQWTLWDFENANFIFYWFHIISLPESAMNQFKNGPLMPGSFCLLCQLLSGLVQLGCKFGLLFYGSLLHWLALHTKRKAFHKLIQLIPVEMTSSLLMKSKCPQLGLGNRR